MVYDKDFHFQHCRERMVERFQLPFTRSDFDELNQRLLFENDVEFLFQPRADTSIYRLTFRGQIMGVFFSEVADCATSILPPDDVRLSGLRPDGTKPKQNFESPARLRRLNRVKAMLTGMLAQ